MTEDQHKEKIERDLLSAMSAIDAANFTMIERLPGFDSSVVQLQNCKATIKRVLNAHFDSLARQKSNSLKK